MRHVVNVYDCNNNRPFIITSLGVDCNDVSNLSAINQIIYRFQLQLRRRIFEIVTIDL